MWRAAQPSTGGHRLLDCCSASLVRPAHALPPATGCLPLGGGGRGEGAAGWATPCGRPLTSTLKMRGSRKTLGCAAGSSRRASCSAASGRVLKRCAGTTVQCGGGTPSRAQTLQGKWEMGERVGAGGEESAATMEKPQGEQAQCSVKSMPAVVRARGGQAGRQALTRGSRSWPAPSVQTQLGGAAACATRRGPPECRLLSAARSGAARRPGACSAAAALLPGCAR